jgi:uncharacterized membrane protein
MPLSLTILGVFGGFIAFGFLGLFIGPTLIAIMFTLVQAWRAAVSAHPAAEVMKPAAYPSQNPDLDHRSHFEPVLMCSWH